MPVQGSPRSYDKKFLFSVEIDGLDVAWFETCSNLEFEIGVIEQHEAGNFNAADKSPGKIKFSPITLSIGATSDKELWDWCKLTIDVAANSGAPDDQYKKNLAIVQRDRDGSVKKRYQIFKSWPSKFVAGAWDAKADENVIQELTLVYSHFDLAT